MEWVVTVVGFLLVTVVVRDMFPTLSIPSVIAVSRRMQFTRPGGRVGSPRCPDGVPARTPAQVVTHTGRRQ